MEKKLILPHQIFINKNRTKIKKKLKPKNIYSNNKFLNSPTFASKLFLKFTSKMLDPIIVCLQTLKFEPENRKIEEIKNTIPYLTTLNNFREYIQFQEKDNSNYDLMVRFAKITFYQYYKKYSILKRPGSNNDIFYILLNGEINKYNLIFEKTSLSIEEYLYYLVKLEIINETEIIKKCHKLNKSLINIGKDEFSLSNFLNKNTKFKYSDIHSKAERDLLHLGINGNLYQNGQLKKVSSIENYLNIFEFNELTKRENEGKPKLSLWIGKYKLASILTKGQFFSNMSDECIKENNIYICRTNCDIGKLDRQKFIEHELNISIKMKMENLFKKVKNDFYFFEKIDDNKFIKNYAPLMLYKKFNKGEKILLQGGMFEGVYLILDGEISLSTEINIDRINKLLINIIFSMKGFPEHIPSFNSLEIIGEFSKRHKVLYNRNDIPYNEYLEIKKIEISKSKKFELLGLNELYDYKTELFNFTAECTSEEATLIYITKNNFNIMLGRESSLYNYLVHLVEFKIQYIAGKLRTYIEQCIKIFNQNVKPNNSIKNYSTSNIRNYNKKNDKITNNNKSNTIINNYSNIKINLNYRNKVIRPLILNYSDKENQFLNKNIMNKMISQTRYNNIKTYDNINNEVDSISSFQKILDSKRADSNSFKGDFEKYNLFNDINLNKKFMKTGFDHIYYNKTPNKFCSNESKIFLKDKLLSTLRGKSLNRFININNNSKISNDSQLLTSNSSLFTGKRLYTSYYEKKFINFQNKKIYPILTKK